MKFPIVHPFLMAIFPIIFIYSHNYYKISSIYFYMILISLIAAGAVFFLFFLLNHSITNKEKTGLYLSVLVTTFYSYGPIFDLNIINYYLNKTTIVIANVNVGPQLILILALCFTCFLIIYFLNRAQKDVVSRFTYFLNIVSISLICISLVNIGVHLILMERSGLDDVNLKSSKISLNLSEKECQTKDPDIYYIILDAHASSNTLKEDFNYNDSEFTCYLKEKGFYVSKNSRSNYAFTDLSLGSSLNMNYLNKFIDIPLIKSNSLGKIDELIQYNEVMRFLKSKGYKIITIESGWGPTSRSNLSDTEAKYVNQDKIARDEYLTILIKNTMLRPVISLFDPYLNENRRGLILFQFDKISDMSKMEGPKFIFAHIICPHSPYIFDDNGNRIIPNLTNWKREDRYLKQLIFIDKKTEIMIDSILNNSKFEPIIIIQSDHGPITTATVDLEITALTSFPDNTTLRERMTILNAYYISKNLNISFYDSITPVNTFRVIFNTLFNKNYDKLNDRSYFSWYDKPYSFVDVTNNITNNSK